MKLKISTIIKFDYVEEINPEELPEESRELLKNESFKDLKNLMKPQVKEYAKRVFGDGEEKTADIEILAFSIDKEENINE